jgi:hypothetical protein
MSKFSPAWIKRSLFSKTASIVAVMTLIPLLGSTPANASTKSVERAAGRTFALTLFSKIPLPSGVNRLSTPVEPLQSVTGSPEYLNAVDVARYYRVSSSVDITTFAESHFPKNESLGTASTPNGGYHTSASFSALSMCPNRHVAYCSVTYSASALNKSQQELRIDIDVVWTPIRVVRLPTSGVVTLTGYEKTSLMNSSSEPVKVVLTSSQVVKLRSAIAQLRTSPGGLCMEDSTLYKISVTPSDKGDAFWSATADECPGQLNVKTQGHLIELNARSCPLETLISSFFPPHSARGTKQGLEACSSSG